MTDFHFWVKNPFNPVWIYQILSTLNYSATLWNSPMINFPTFLFVKLVSISLNSQDICSESLSYGQGKAINWVEIRTPGGVFSSVVDVLLGISVVVLLHHLATEHQLAKLTQEFTFLSMLACSSGLRRQAAPIQDGSSTIQYFTVGWGFDVGVLWCFSTYGIAWFPSKQTSVSKMLTLWDIQEHFENLRHAVCRCFWQ